jgi:hypothetical protein
MYAPIIYFKFSNIFLLKKYNAMNRFRLLAVWLARRERNDEQRRDVSREIQLRGARCAFVECETWRCGTNREIFFEPRKKKKKKKKKNETQQALLVAAVRVAGDRCAV